MSCSSANQYMSNLVGGTDAQITNSVHGQLAQVSTQYNTLHQGSSPAQFGGTRRRSRKHMRRRMTKHSKKRSHKRKSRKIIRKRK